MRTAPGSSGSAASKSMIATVGMSGPHSSALIHAVRCWVQPQPYPAADTLTRVGEVEVPALVPQRFVGRGMRAPRRRPAGVSGSAARTRFGQDGQRVGVEHMLAMPLQHRHEHLVAAVGALDEHRRDDRHHHPEEALPAHAVADVVEADRRVGPSASW